MPQHMVNFWRRTNSVIAPTGENHDDAAVPIQTASTASVQSGTQPGTQSDTQSATQPGTRPATEPAATRRTGQGPSHLQSAWRVRQFAANAYFGSVAIPRSMSSADLAEVQEALDRLGPFGPDRIDNFARLHTGLISANAASAQAVLALVRHRIINPNQRGPDGDTLLHSLVEHGRQDSVKGMNESAHISMRFDERLTELIAAGASLYATDRENRTAFERILSSTRPDWKTVAEAILHIAPEECYLRKVKNGPTLLHRAARLGDTTLVERWIALGLPTELGLTSWRDVPDPELHTPLRRALKSQTLAGIEIARMLIASGANPYRRSPFSGKTMLHRAACDGDIKLIKGWLAAGLSLSTPTAHRARLTALMLAVGQQPKRDDLLTLIARNTEVNERDNYGRTALHHAVMSRKSYRAINALVAAGADLNMHTNAGSSPLAVSITTASETHDDLGFWLLVGHGADLDLPNPRTGQLPRDSYNLHSIRWNGPPLP